MESVRQTQKKYCSRAIMLAICCGLLCVLADQIPVGKGLILGTIFSIVNFVIIGETLPVRMDKSKKKIFFIALGSIFFRYVLMAIPLVISIKFEQFNMIAATVGIFMVQLMILADNLFNLISSTRGKQF